MPERANPSLSDILKTFRAARSADGNGALSKKANEGESCDPALADSACAPDASFTHHPDTCQCPECADSANTQADINDLAAAAQQLDAASAEAASAEEQVVDAAETLKAVADEFIEERAGTIAKEAQLFGQLFAASCMEQMNKTAKMQEREAMAYNLAANAISGENNMQTVLPLEKAAALHDEAWRVTMAKLAGFEDDEEMERAVGQELTPEDIVAIVQAAQEADDAEGTEAEEADAVALAQLIAANQEAGDGDLTDEEVQALAAQLAAAENDESEEDVDPEAVAAAANLLADVREGDVAEELDKAASLAYDTATAGIYGDDLTKTASEAYGFAFDAVWNERMQKTAQEAYALTAQSLGY